MMSLSAAFQLFVWHVRDFTYTTKTLPALKAREASPQASHARAGEFRAWVVLPQLRHLG
jgi:hypothetical protein